MKLNIITPDSCGTVADCVVVVDVWRSFTTTAYAFAAGAREILVTASAKEAFALRTHFPQSTLIGMGKLGGEPAPGFDYCNSPAEVRKRDWHDQRIILCTPNGTPGLVRNVNARTLMASSLVCAHATVEYLKNRAIEHVSFVCTETGIADRSCAEYMTGLLRNDHLDTNKMLDRIRAAGLEHGQTLLARGALTGTQWNKLQADLICCLDLNRFDFAMLVERRDGILVMDAINPN